MASKKQSIDIEGGKVVYLADDYEAIRLLKLTIQEIREDQLDAFVLITRSRANGGLIRWSWYAMGEMVCSRIIGLLEYMKITVMEFWRNS